MWFTSSCGRIQLQITKAQAAIGYHQGQCADDIEDLMLVPAIKRQLVKLDKEAVIEELLGYGAWEKEELLDHRDNIAKLLWLACADIIERG